MQVLWPLPVPMVPPGVSIEIQAQDMEVGALACDGWGDWDSGTQVHT